MSSIIRPFNIMCKPVCGTCNLDCCYCYYTAKPRELYPDATKFLMSETVLDSYTRQYIQTQPQQCEFGWQGGEPTLAGIEFFRKAVELQKQYKLGEQTINNALQTNGTLLNHEWCEFLAAEKFLVGLSLDGPPQWHDTFRRDRANNPTFHRAWAGLELLRKHKVEFNVLVTLNSANAPHAGDIYRYFTNRGVSYLQFIPILERTPDGKPTPFSCSGEQFGRFLLDVFEIWATRDVGAVSERLIDNVLHQLIYGQASTCCYADRCANAHVLEWNGDLYVCDHFVYKQWRVGNIMDRPLEDLVRDAMLDDFALLKSELPAACAACEFLQFCRGGCPKHHMPIGKDPARVNHFCEGYKAFFTHALPILAQMAEYIKAGQTPPLAKLAGDGGKAPKSAARPAPGAAPPNRNASCPCGSGRKFKSCCGRT